VTNSIAAVEVPPAPHERVAALEAWTEAYHEWKAWRLRWNNRPEPGWFSSRERRDEPVPPPWLAPACRTVLERAGPLADACEALRDWQHSADLTAWLAAAQYAAGRPRDGVQKTQWWERIHVDAFWPMTQAGAGGFGVVGAHVTVRVAGRLQIFVAPGAIVMRLPALDGSQRWTPATDWGFSVRLFDFRMPGLDRASTAHFNLARVWVLGEKGIQVPGELYLAGFSLTFKRR
jgi:hypothetical protein